MTVQVNLPPDLLAAIDNMTADRDAFIEHAVRRLLGDAGQPSGDEVARINRVVDELNREAEDVLEYQVMS